MHILITTVCVVNLHQFKIGTKVMRLHETSNNFELERNLNEIG